MLAHAKIDWKDDRISQNKWPEMKENAPGNSMPYITYKDGVQVGDSMKISKLLGQAHGYYTLDPVERAMIDEHLHNTNDYFPGVAMPMYCPQD